MSEPKALLVLPHLRIQNANAISSQMTWGFPAMSAFVGAMQALERKLPTAGLDLIFTGVGVICHGFDAQVNQTGFTRRFLLTRNPVGKDGSTAAIVEEGRVHLDVTLVLGAEGALCSADPGRREEVAAELARIVSGMRLAGGSVMPALPGQRKSWQRPQLVVLDEDPGERHKQFLNLRRGWLPGFVLVGRDDLLAQSLAELRKEDPAATELDAWLDCSRLTLHYAPEASDRKKAGADSNEQDRPSFSWQVRKSPGWVVPIPVGYGALSPCYEAGSVANARDAVTPFRFVEGLYSVGQWISPHRLNRAQDMLWYAHSDTDAGLYRLRNDYQPS
ncbi:MAG: type I-F CRISPR-associated protein Csy2 [Alcanivorax sp.]|uniref:type I-F CRISPR-associated protein Csy2 n=1 Tax=Alloalcanivorax marinus TaxID=1177169 RepID=UPI001958E930|nr:type I-F CRISPR-associated protein Csy2 [Alloalcanivorax marinus]MBM7332392.1 type I-F CRISPR-associated protein Csy2 [Alloalcanivorax marinus]